MVSAWSLRAKRICPFGSNPVQFVEIAASLTLLAMTRGWHNHEKLRPYKKPSSFNFYFDIVQFKAF
jgi:hypothetical protein